MYVEDMTKVLLAVCGILLPAQSVGSYFSSAISAGLSDNKYAQFLSFWAN